MVFFILTKAITSFDEPVFEILLPMGKDIRKCLLLLVSIDFRERSEMRKAICWRCMSKIILCKPMDLFVKFFFIHIDKVRQLPC